MPSTSNPTLDQKEVYLTLPEASQYLRVSTRTVYRWLVKGKIKYFRVDKSTRISLSDLERFIAENTLLGPKE
jgi:excisionase family DNA binding protein